MICSITGMEGLKALLLKSKYIVLPLIVVSIWLGSGVRAYADDSSKVLISFGTDSGNEIWFYTEQTMYYTEDAYTYNDIVVPVYFRFKNNYSLGYFSGYVIVYTTPFNFVDGNSNRLVINYFEDITDSIYVDYLKNSGTYQIVFDNSHIRSNVDILIGYMHLMSNNTSGSLTITCNNRLQQANIGNNQLYQTSYEYGAVNAFVYAINNASDINTIIDYLYIIKNNIPLINDVLSELESQSTVLNTLSSKLTDIYNKDVQLYNLLYNYINNSNNGANAASQAAADLAGAAANQHAAEASLAALSPGNMSDLDSADGLAVLDNVTNATRFWSTLVTQFSEVSGILWGFFIIALLLGLIAFILRLR